MHKLTEQKILINTYWSDKVYENTLSKINDYQTDNKSTTRLLRCECKSCFYLKGDRISTQAFTEYNCWNCEEVNMHHNGGTPRYCEKCSNEYNVCVRCGGEL